MVFHPEGGKRSPGGQKLRWNDVVTQDLRQGGILSDWKQLTQDRKEWRGVVATVVKDLNRKAEEKEQRKKDERKRRREEAVMPASAWTCSYRECSFAAQSKAGLVNHQRKKHGSQSTTRVPCPHCSRLFRPQGLRNHIRACAKKSQQRQCSLHQSSD